MGSNQKKTRELKMHSETKNKDYKARLKFDKEQNKVVLDFGVDNASVADVEIKCGLCQNGVGKVLKKVGQYGVYYKCENCGAIIPETYLGHKFSREDIEDLFMGDSIKGRFISKKKKYFEASVHIENGKLKMEF